MIAAPESLLMNFAGGLAQLGMRLLALAAHQMGRRGREAEAWLRERIAILEAAEEELG